MSNGSIAYGPSEFLDLFDSNIRQQMNLEQNVKFKPNSKVKVIVSVEELTQYFLKDEPSYMSAKNHALIILGNQVGTVIGANKFDEGLFYTIEFETEPMCLLPEKFLSY